MIVFEILSWIAPFFLIGLGIYGVCAQRKLMVGPPEPKHWWERNYPSPGPQVDWAEFERRIALALEEADDPWIELSSSQIRATIRQCQDRRVLHRVR